MDVDPFPPIDTRRLILRCVTATDAAATSALMTPAVSRWVASWPVPFTHALAAERIEAARRLAHAGNALPFAVVAKASNDLVGWAIAHRDADDPRRASMGYWLGEKHQRRGYMSEIAPTVVAAGFRLLGVDVIEAAAQVANAGSFAVMEHIGMTPVCDAMVYAPSRAREELCRRYEVKRPASLS